MRYITTSDTGPTLSNSSQNDFCTKNQSHSLTCLSATVRDNVRSNYRNFEFITVD